MNATLSPSSSSSCSTIPTIGTANTITNSAPITSPSPPPQQQQHHQQQPLLLQVNATKADTSQALLYAADFAASWSSFATALIITHPLDSLRIRRQTHGQTVRHTLNHDGGRSLYKGFTTPLAANGPLFAHAFAMNEFCRGCVRRYYSLPTDAPLSTKQMFVAGSAAGATLTPLTCPVDVMRLQQQVAGRRGHKGAQDLKGILREIRETVGLRRGLYRGVSLSLFCSALGRGCYFTAYETMKTNSSFQSLTTLGGQLPTLATQICAAIVASWCGWLPMFPGDVLRNRLQSDGFHDPRFRYTVVTNPPNAQLRFRKYESIAHCARMTYREGGVRAFYAGLPLTLLRGVFSSGISLPLFDTLKPVYRGCVS